MNPTPAVNSPVMRQPPPSHLGAVSYSGHQSPHPSHFHTPNSKKRINLRQSISEIVEDVGRVSQSATGTGIAESCVATLPRFRSHPPPSVSGTGRIESRTTPVRSPLHWGLAIGPQQLLINRSSRTRSTFPTFAKTRSSQLAKSPRQLLQVNVPT